MALQHEFATAFAEADQVIVLNIFASREQDDGLINSSKLVNQIRHPNVRYIDSFTAAADYLLEHITPPAVLLTLGAGDGYQVGEWVLQGLRV
jgi:UDP-N-acetylmuramate--alanine ligase